MEKKKQNNTVVTRFAPSPTGNLHVGSARTALFSFLYARGCGGKFILRIEDTDKERSKKEFEESILASMEWLGFSYDEMYRQSERTEIYKKYLQKLIDSGSAYISKEEVKQEGDRSEVIRFKNPNKTVTFADEIRGEVTFDTTELGDFVIAKDVKNPLYHFVVVVDDLEMGVTHVIRGEDHISNTPRQILIQEAIGAPRPTYAHIPLTLAADRSKLSKRHGAVSVEEYKKMGYLPEALVNFLALLGWNPGNDKEIFSIDELIKEFSLKKMQKGGAMFNFDKLDWVNKQHIARLDTEELFAKIKERLSEEILSLPQYSDERLKTILSVITERISKFADVENMAKEGELSYFFEQPTYEADKLLWKKNPDPLVAKQHLDKVVEFLGSIDADDFTQENVKKAIWDYAGEEGRGDVLWPTRFALCGRDRSPDPLALAEIFGKEETIKRLNFAARSLEDIS
ncbi:MAG: glutamate--tRNA ligase [Candidatus Pacebacteria bacterium]|nr:glutamate--tRNA ligase [Candidatus Paceibacterota bacterium]